MAIAGIVALIPGIACLSLAGAASAAPAAGSGAGVGAAPAAVEARRFEPRWGLGVSVAGPSFFLSMTGQFRPTQHLVLELGVMPPAPGVFAGWTGARALAPRLGPVQPFLGAFVFGAAMSGEGPDGAGGPVSWAGGRTGLDILLPGDRHALTLELDVLRGLGSSEMPKFLHCADRWQACAWGGVGYAYLW